MLKNKKVGNNLVYSDKGIVLRGAILGDYTPLGKEKKLEARSSLEHSP